MIELTARSPDLSSQAVEDGKPRWKQRILEFLSEDIFAEECWTILLGHCRDAREKARRTGTQVANRSRTLPHVQLTGTLV